MPHRATAPLGTPCWIDLMTADIERSRAFYSQLFGWTADEPREEFGGYVNFHKNGDVVAGCMSWPDAGDGVWSVYLATDDARKTVEKVTAAGGRVLRDVMQVGDVGSMAMVTDPGGATIGVWQPGEHQGFTVIGEDAAPGWFELHTRDHAASVEFYRSAFGWETVAVGDTPEFRYTVATDGAEQVAGVMDATAFLPGGVPAHWSVYFAVDDVDATLARAVELGGAVATAAEDTPYGRIAVARDATGAQFKLRGPNQSPQTGQPAPA